MINKDAKLEDRYLAKAIANRKDKDSLYKLLCKKVHAFDALMFFMTALSMIILSSILRHEIGESHGQVIHLFSTKNLSSYGYVVTDSYGDQFIDVSKLKNNEEVSDKQQSNLEYLVERIPLSWYKFERPDFIEKNNDIVISRLYEFVFAIALFGLASWRYTYKFASKFVGYRYVYNVEKKDKKNSYSIGEKVTFTTLTNTSLLSGVLIVITSFVLLLNTDNGNRLFNYDHYAIITYTYFLTGFGCFFLLSSLKELFTNRNELIFNGDSKVNDLRESCLKKDKEIEAMKKEVLSKSDVIESLNGRMIDCKKDPEQLSEIRLLMKEAQDIVDKEDKILLEAETNKKSILESSVYKQN